MIFTIDVYAKYIRTAIGGGNINNLANSDLERMPCAIPSDGDEQQKIADCLASLDDRIAAETRQLDALKTHKQGLLQQLFPREGETVPRIRFPTLQASSTWLTRNVGDMMPVGSSKRVHQSDWTDEGVPFYRAREIVALSEGEDIEPLHITEQLYSEYSSQTGEIQPGHLLVTGVGSIGVPYLVGNTDRFYFKDGNIIWLKNNQEHVSGVFLHLAYTTTAVQGQIKYMAGVGTVGTYTIASAKETKISFPEDKAEQQKIADCLTSLDDLIADQSKKIDLLKQHKRGLMQRLFPVLDPAA